MSGSASSYCTTVKINNLPASEKKPVNIFKTRYIQYCSDMNTKPVRGLLLQVSNGSLDIAVDKIKYADWLPLLKAINKDRNMHFIGLKSNHTPGTIILEHVNTEKLAQQLEKGSVLFTKYMILKVNEAIANCISNSRCLTCLQFRFIPQPTEAMTILTRAIARSQSLQHISFEHCNVGDNGCNLILQALKNAPSVISLDLSDCNITKVGASYIAELIKLQEIARFGECWKHSLRYREVPHDIIPGLRRITLNNNPQIGDEGLQSLIIILCDDYWIKAIDMQNCGITDYGCSSVIDLINMNHEIAVFDIRKNPVKDTDKISQIIKILYSHVNENDRSDYGWMKDTSSCSQKNSGNGSLTSITALNVVTACKGSRSASALYDASKQVNFDVSTSCWKVVSNRARSSQQKKVDTRKCSVIDNKTDNKSLTSGKSKNDIFTGSRDKKWY